MDFFRLTANQNRENLVVTKRTDFCGWEPSDQPKVENTVHAISFI